MTIALLRDMKMKSVKMFKDAMLEDETFVKSMGTSEIEVCIKQSELTGQVGRVICEASEQFPVSTVEQRGTFMKLIEMQFQPFMDIISLPENASYLADVLGLRRLYIPGDCDRNKQLREIAFLLSSGPVMGMTQQMDAAGNVVEVPQQQPSVPIDPVVDNHQIEAEVCSVFLRSEVGQYTKETNPEGYANILAHMQAHQMILQQQQQQALAQQQQQQAAQDGEDISVSDPSQEVPSA